MFTLRLWLFTSILFFSATVLAQTVDQARISGLAWLVLHQYGDGSWKSSGGLSIQPTAAALDALSNAGIKKGYVYSIGESWLSNADGTSVDSLSRKIIALSHAGANVASATAQLLQQRNDIAIAWGAYPKYQATFPDSALAMDAILVSGITYADTRTTLGFIQGTQNADGGWPYSTSALGSSPASSLIPTAYSVLALSHARARYLVDTNITNGVNWVIAKAKTDGGFSEDTAVSTGSSLETAIVYLALQQAAAAGNAAAVAAQSTINNALTFLINNQSADGSWGGDSFTTAMALQTLPALAPGALPDSNNSGVPDAVETALGLNSSAANRQIALNNGQNVPGQTSAKLLGQGIVGQPMRLFLSAQNGIPPYTWNISGPLPDGLSWSPMSAAATDPNTITIFGTPSSSGTFNFSYTVADTNGSSRTVNAQIVIGAGVPISYTLNLTSGWNLVGNSLDSTIDVKAAYGDANKFTTVWRWDAFKAMWDFYTPTLADGGAAYAASKGYDFLTTINPGDGYWLNVPVPISLAQTGVGFSLARSDLLPGWNTVATADNVGPQDFNRALSGAVDGFPINITTLWAWDAAKSNWLFYAPSLDANGTLASYNLSRGYESFGPLTTPTLGNGLGIWLNVPFQGIDFSQ